MSKLNLHISRKIFLDIYYPYLWNYDSRYNIYYGGRSSGKTFFIIQKLLLKGLKEKRVILLMKDTTAAVKDTVWKELKLAIERFGLNSYFEFNKTDFRATCKLNGTEFRCLGLNAEAEKIKGYANLSDVYLDELTAFTPEEYEIIDGTLRSKEYKLPLQIYGSFNPISKANWVYKYFGFESGEAPADTFILKTTYLDNPKADCINRMEQLKARNPQRYKVEALGDFVSLDRLIFTNWKIQDFDRNELKQLPLLCGLDFGFINDATAFICSLLDEDSKKLYVFNTWYAKGKTNDEIAAAIKAMGFSKSVIVADAAEQKSIEELRRLGVTRVRACRKGADSIIHGIQKLQQYDIVVSPTCEELITELENYAWSKDRASGEYINKPIDNFNHCIDALRYSLQCGAETIKTFDKTLLGL